MPYHFTNDMQPALIAYPETKAHTRICRINPSMLF